ncbi:MAG: hypothetical protein FWF81_10960 [Defluviitaleaceae bacterium]|nr:hypothetical protein [Defluviitaleaceae bacterium]
MSAISAYPFNGLSETNGLSESFQAKAAKFKELTGREIVIEKNDNGEFIHMLSPESTQRFGFMLDFFRVGFDIENLARRYTELREELMEKYKDNEDHFYIRMGELNHAFEIALQNTLLLPLQQTLTDISDESQEYNSQIISTFFEAFIKSIQNTDFETAFAKSWENMHD